MPDPIDFSLDDETLAVPGSLYVGRDRTGKKRVRIGPSAGWLVPRGITNWEREISLVARVDLTAQVSSALRATMPHEQIASKRHPLSARAVTVAPFLPIANGLASDARKEGLRVHTVGVDRVSAGFFYFIEGGHADPVRVQGNLIEMLAPSLDAESSNAHIEDLLDGLIDRLLVSVSGGVLSELDIELADAMPRMSRDGAGLVGTDLDGFEAQATALRTRTLRFAEDAKALAQAISSASPTADALTRPPLYEHARAVERPPLLILVGGKPLMLPKQVLWFVTGPPRHKAPWTVPTGPAKSAYGAPTRVASPPFGAVVPAKSLAAFSAPVAASTPVREAEIVPEPPTVLQPVAFSETAALRATPVAPSTSIVEPAPPAEQDGVLSDSLTEPSAPYGAPMPFAERDPVPAPISYSERDALTGSVPSAPPVELPSLQAVRDPDVAAELLAARNSSRSRSADMMEVRVPATSAFQTPRALAIVLLLVALVLTYLAYQFHWVQWS